MLSDSVSASCILSFSFSSSLSASSFSSHVYPVNDARKMSSLARIKDFQFSIFMRIHTICSFSFLQMCEKARLFESSKINCMSFEIQCKHHKKNRMREQAPDIHLFVSHPMHAFQFNKIITCVLSSPKSDRSACFRLGESVSALDMM